MQNGLDKQNPQYTSPIHDDSIKNSPSSGVTDTESPANSSDSEASHDMHAINLQEEFDRALNDSTSDASETFEIENPIHRQTRGRFTDIVAPFEVEDIENRPTATERHVTLLQQENDPFFVTSRIIRHMKLSLMSTLPTPDKTWEQTSIITPNGLFQLNKELNQFHLILSPEQLESLELGIWLNQAAGVPETESRSLYPYLTLPQLNQLERLIRAHRGFTITGYNCIEEFWLRLIGLPLCQQDFPPLPNSWPRKLLNVVQMPVVEDLTLTIRGIIHAFIIYGFVGDAYFEDTQNNVVAAWHFTQQNSAWLLLGCLSLGLINFSLLRSSLLPKEQALKFINRFNLLLATTIGYAENWENYASLALPEDILLYLLFPIVVTGIIRGFYRQEKNTPHEIDITKFTYLKFLWNASCYALTEGSLWSLGMLYPINSMEFIFKKTSDSTIKALNEDMAAVRYSVCLIAFLAQLTRLPHGNINCQVFGRYASNIISAIGESLLDNAALSTLLGVTYGVLFNQTPSPKDTGQLTMYFGCQVLFAILTFLFSFPITSPLPEYYISEHTSKSHNSTIPDHSNSQHQQKKHSYISTMFGFWHIKTHENAPDIGANLALSFSNLGTPAALSNNI